MLHVHEQFTHV